MLNTITLSSDLRTLYLIDDGRLIAYNLEKAQGVIVGVMDGQIAVVSGRRRLPDIQGGRTAGVRRTNDPTVLAAASTEAVASAATTASATDARSFKFQLPENTQFTSTFNPGTNTLGIMGATDIIAERTTPTGEPLPPAGNCELVLFDLNRTQIFLRRLDTTFLVEERLITGS